MARHYALSAVPKNTQGKGAARAVRKAALVPAVIYGAGLPPVTVALPSGLVNGEYNRGHMLTSLCTLDMEGKTQQVLVCDVQVHPVTDRVLHVDFIRVTADTKVAVRVPVQFINEDLCLGLQQKGTLSIVHHEVELLCAATHIPEVLEVDLTDLQNGQSVHMIHAKMPQGATPIATDEGFAIATLHAPRRADAQDETTSTDVA